jgi:hypothetical protein
MGYLPSSGEFGSLVGNPPDYETRFVGLSMLPNPFTHGDNVVFGAALERFVEGVWLPMPAGKIVSIKKNGAGVASPQTDANGIISYTITNAQEADEGLYTVEYAGE